MNAVGSIAQITIQDRCYFSQQGIKNPAFIGAVAGAGFAQHPRRDVTN